MGDGDHGLALHQCVQIFLDCSLHLAVEGRRGLVKDEDRRILQQHARNRHALPLATGKLHATLAHMGLVATPSIGIDQVGDELGGMRLLCCGHDVGFAGVGAAIADVVADRAVQQRGVLRHDADRSAERDSCETSAMFWPSMVMVPEPIS